ncbi:hypothetical protein ABL78_2698 [Leptomonas seymouri]|uniref:C2HC/C3H-type domain-containing protein n=1 Tax=Leptomonas seymouri TaxID=5684 RepID=A0A0N1HYW4_LEPSE|nr:hypothetical protein ABL78_2698 [Leptomonas seymouri]|eukprot:KPI88194.1 hypothetical protein ABL78_2698 [Leptomonas seymouri]
MPRPHFITCQLCGKGFGSASINIHIPQCYEKAIKRWKLDPVGPRPVMPALYGNAGAAKRSGSNGGTIRNTMMNSGAMGLDEQPCGGGMAAARSLHAQNTLPMMEEAPTNMNLHPCSKCGRSFNYDRISYHESVCKGDQKRRVFDSSKQRCVSGEGSDGFGSVFGRTGGGKGKKRKLGTANTTSNYTPAPAPQTNWRQQHEEFIDAIRSARRAGAESQSMWGTSSVDVAQGRRQMAPTRGPQRAPFTRSAFQGGASGGGGAAGALYTRGMPPPSQRVPALMVKQSESRKQNIASGGRASQAKPSAPVPPSRGGAVRPGSRASPPQQLQRSSFGTGDRFSGRGYNVGGDGGGRLLNTNVSSIGMLQSMGQA